MVNFILKRPIGTGMFLCLIIIFSTISFQRLPISLLPSIQIPELIVKVNAPNYAPQQVENSILKPIREQLATQNNLLNLESKASSEYGIIKLQFEYETDIQLTYLNLNEQIDRLSNVLPVGVDRPIRITNATDSCILIASLNEDD